MTNRTQIVSRSAEYDFTSITLTTNPCPFHKLHLELTEKYLYVTVVLYVGFCAVDSTLAGTSCHTKHPDVVQLHFSWVARLHNFRRYFALITTPLSNKLILLTKVPIRTHASAEKCTEIETACNFEKLENIILYPDHDSESVLLPTVCLWNYLRHAILTLLITVIFRALFSNNVVGNFLQNIVHAKMSFVILYNCIQLCLLYFLIVFSLLLSFYDE